MKRRRSRQEAKPRTGGKLAEIRPPLNGAMWSVPALVDRPEGSRKPMACGFLAIECSVCSLRTRSRRKLVMPLMTAARLWGTGQFHTTVASPKGHEAASQALQSTGSSTYSTMGILWRFSMRWIIAAPQVRVPIFLRLQRSDSSLSSRAGAAAWGEPTGWLLARFPKTLTRPRGASLNPDWSTVSGAVETCR